VGVRIWADGLPAPEVPEVSVLSSADAMKLALHGGEDYELLFTIPRRKIDQIGRRIRGVQIHRIGEISRSKAISLVLTNGKEVTLKPAGYDHFENLISTTKGRRTQSH